MVHYIGNKKKKTGFTLTELLIVIAIIGVMVAFLTPVIGRAREGGKRAACAGNLRQIGIAIHLYADDHDEYPPPPAPPPPSPYEYWFDLLLPYLDNNMAVFLCPSLIPKPNSPAYSNIDYSYNAGLTSYSDKWSFNSQRSYYRISAMLRPSQQIFALDIYITTPWGDPYEFINNSAQITERHGKGVNVVRVDGSVQWYLKETLTSNPLWFYNFVD